MMRFGLHISDTRVWPTCGANMMAIGALVAVPWCRVQRVWGVQMIR